MTVGSQEPAKRDKSANPYASPLTDVGLAEVAPGEPVPINLWIGFLYRPRAAMRWWLAEEQSSWIVWALAVFELWAIGASALAVVIPTDEWEIRTPEAIIFGFILVVTGVGNATVWLMLISTLYRGAGERLGGTGTISDVRAAIAWSGTVWLWASAAILPAAVIVRTMTSVIEEMIESPSLAKMGIPLAAGLWVAVWRFWSLISALAEAHRFSAWKAIATVLLAALLPIVVGGGLTYLLFGVLKL